MEVFYYRGARPNFGDDINEHLWDELLPPAVREAPDVVLVGIGSILTQEWLGHLEGSGMRVVVLGTGTSYDAPPEAVGSWDVLAVRGPGTAELIGRPETAVTDGAILVADAPRLRGPARPRTETLFMPHHRTLRRTGWSEIAAEAGMRLVSPQQSVAEVMEAYAGASLVVTEAMHGAIVADALRIPWVPVVISPAVDEFKWRDWGRSVGVGYEPLAVPAVDARDRGRFRRMERVLRRHGVAGHANLGPAPGGSELRDYFARRFSPETKRQLLAADHGTRSERAVALTGLPADRGHRRRAVDALRSAARSTPSLSDDARFASLLERMREAVGQVQELALRG